VPALGAATGGAVGVPAVGAGPIVPGAQTQIVIKGGSCGQFANGTPPFRPAVCKSPLFYSHALYYTVSNKHRTTRYRDWYVYGLFHLDFTCR
jgi:hypothetical protein